MLKFSKTGKTASQEQLHNSKMSSQRLEQDMGSLSLSDKSRLPPTTAPTFYSSGKKYAPVVAPKPKKSQVQAAYQAQRTTEFTPSGAGARTQENYARAQPNRYDDDDFPPPPPPQEMTSYSSEPLPPPPNNADEMFPPPPPETTYSKRTNGYSSSRPQDQYNPSPTNYSPSPSSSSYTPSPTQSYSPQPTRTYTPPSSTRSYSPTTPVQSTYHPPRTYTPPQSNYTPSNTYNSSYSPTSTYSSSSSSYSTPGSYNRTAGKSAPQSYTPPQQRVNVNPSPSYSSPNSNIPSFNVSVNAPAANPAPPQAQPQKSGGGVTLTKSPEEELDALTKCLVDKMENPETDFFDDGICGNCGQKVVVDEEGCSTMDKIFHVRCFTCTTCGCRLSSKPFYAMENHPYCEECYINSLEKCSVCSKPIMDRIIRATGKPYHPGCFTCVVCGKSLDGIPFTVDATNQIHCLEDFHNKFAPRCSVCHEPIMPEPDQEETIRVIVMDRNFHVSCFKCEDCGMILSSEDEGRGCYPLDDHVLCRECNTKRIRALSARISTEL